MKLLVYYHCLYYRVGGIGIFIAKTGLEVTANTSFSLTIQGWSTFLEKLHLLAVVFVFEAGLRIISHLTSDESGKSRYPLLSPNTSAQYLRSFMLVRLFGVLYLATVSVESISFHH
jgi:hypothetical protein